MTLYCPDKGQNIIDKTKFHDNIIMKYCPGALSLEDIISQDIILLYTSTTKTCCHDIAEILLKVALSTKQIYQSININ
jgi:hypothetical protein